MLRSGTTDLPLHGGKVPAWLHQRMAKLGRAIIEVIVADFGHDEVIRRLSDPFWFQSFGAVLGMDWHSSGITTSVMGALKKSLNPISHELGIYICGGRGKSSRKTPAELLSLANQYGFDGDALVRTSRLSAKVDNTAVQDGFQIYLHNFILTHDQKWAVVQQGMNPNSATARRYHWHSAHVESFTREPHAAVCGKNQGMILNLVAEGAQSTQQCMLNFQNELPSRLIKEATKLIMPAHHDVRAKDIDLKRLGVILHLAHETQPEDFEDLLLLRGLGPRTLQSLALVSEIIYGKPSRFQDPARYSFAHGGKDGDPFPVPLKVYDQSIEFMHTLVEKASLDLTDRKLAFKSLHRISKRMESLYTPDPRKYPDYLEWERKNSRSWGGRSTKDDLSENRQRPNDQLSLF